MGSIRTFAAMGLVFALVGCGDDGGGSEGSGSASMSTTAGSSEDGSTSATATGSESTASTSTTATDSGGAVCEGLLEEDCLPDLMCLSLRGRPVLMSDAGLCLGPAEFIECIQDDPACGAAVVYACPPDSDEIYAFGTLCIPTDWTECTPGGDAIPDCP